MAHFKHSRAGRNSSLPPRPPGSIALSAKTHETGAVKKRKCPRLRRSSCSVCNRTGRRFPGVRRLAPAIFSRSCILLSAHGQAPAPRLRWGSKEFPAPDKLSARSARLRGPMRLVTFESAPNLRRIGAVAPNGEIVDLNLAYALYLRDVQRESTYTRLAAAVVPLVMRELFEGGDSSLQAAATALAYVLGLAPPVNGPGGEK